MSLIASILQFLSVFFLRHIERYSDQPNIPSKRSSQRSQKQQLWFESSISFLIVKEASKLTSPTNSYSFQNGRTILHLESLVTRGTP